MMFFLYIAAVSVVLLIAYAVSGFIPLAYLGSTITTVLILGALPCLPQLYKKLWKGQYDKIGQVTPTSVAIVILFNFFITLPAILFSTEVDRYNYFDKLSENGIFIPHGR